MTALLYPIIEYAHKIGKNTADLTTMDMVAFMKWWMKQAPRKDILTMAKKYSVSKYKDAQTSRLAERGIESPINDGVEEIVVHDSDEVVCEMGLTKLDLLALLFALDRVMADYELDGNEYGESLKSLYKSLKEVEVGL